MTIMHMGMKTVTPQAIMKNNFGYFFKNAYQIKVQLSKKLTYGTTNGAQEKK